MSRDMINALADSDNLGAESHFKSALSQKIGDALEYKRKEVASTMVTQHIPEVVEEDEEV
tara:strand:- start:746 stop:925 length:180 start_codon:yes stop_codon:yes gene_type:complete